MKGERMKNIEEMSDRELLEELVAAKRRDQIIEYIKWGVIAVFIISIYAMIARYIPQIKAFLDASNTLINDLEATNQQINDVMGQLNDGSLEQLKELLNSMNDGSIDKLKELIEKLNSILGVFKF